MNLGEQLAKILLEQDKQTIALFPGAFKPPHKGHVEVVKKLLDKADQVVVLVSPKMRDGVSAEESIAVWNLYKKLFDGPVEVKISSEASPVGEVYDVVKDNLDTDFIVAFGKGEESRYARMADQPNTTIFDGGTIEGANATNLRMALATNNTEEIAKYLPDGITVDEFLAAINEEPVEQPAEEIPADLVPETPLQESPPVDDMNDDYYNYVESNRDKIEKIAQVFNYPIEDMLLAFQGGTPTIMSDDMWGALENSESHRTKDLEDAISRALKLGINPRPYIDQIKKKKEMPLPLVLQYNPGKFYLVGGEVVLSILKALGAIPQVLVGNITPKTQTLPEPIFESVQGKLTESQTATLGEFIKYAIKNLNIQKPPSGLTVSYDTNTARERSSFGTFNPENDKIWLYVGNRNMADILRTLAHELVHRKQHEDGRIDYKSGETGSEIENEANAQAGILLRNFGKNHKYIYEGKYGDYLFGDKESGVKIGWYNSEKEEDTPAEKKLFDFLKKYADSEAETYSNISLDHLIPIFKLIKKQYPEVGESKAKGYIYRGTVTSKDKLDTLLQEPNIEEIGQNIIIPNQEYSSRRKASSWSTNYYNAAAFAVSTAERKGGIPVVVRAKANDAELFFNPKFINKLSNQLEDEVINITNPIPVDIMLIKEYKDEFEDIELGYLSNK